MKLLRTFLVLVVLASCGGTPFDEDYWDDDLSEEERQEDADGELVATLSPVSALSFGRAEAVVQLSGNAASLRVEVEQLPQNLVQGTIQVTSTPCSSFSAEPPTTGAVETKSYTYTENGTRASLFSEVTTDDTVEGKNMVLFVLDEGSVNTSGTTLFALACGTLTRTADSRPSGTTTTTAGTTGATVTGTVTAGTTGDFTTTGTTGDFTTAGTTAGTTGDFTTAGTTTGTTVGTVGGTVGTTTGGFVGF